MTEELHIIKQKEDWKYSVEIKETAKLEPCITIKTRSDASAKEAVAEALKVYQETVKELGR